MFFNEKRSSSATLRKDNTASQNTSSRCRPKYAARYHSQNDMADATVVCDSAQPSLSLQCFLLKVLLGVILGGQHSEVRTSEPEDL